MYQQTLFFLGGSGGSLVLGGLHESVGLGQHGINGSGGGGGTLEELLGLVVSLRALGSIN